MFPLHLLAYIDPIVQSTFNQDGSIQEIVRALSTRLRDSNTTVAFKALLVLHQMLRSGALEPTFSYLASSSVTSQLSSHEAPNISAYGQYLACRIKSYANLKRDVIRDKADRRSMSRLRTLTVEGGLLRETREVQRMIATLVESKFYADDIDDEVSMTALRFLVKDLLVLFTAVNEGVINVLEHYFEMSHVDATTALKIYKTFCRDTEKVVAYLGIAKKLQHVTNIPIPNLKHVQTDSHTPTPPYQAPVSLVSSLEEYLNDPNFEHNREEYKENKRIADGKPRSSSKAPATSAPSAATASTSAAAPSASTSSATPSSTEAPKAPTSFTDFFESIEQSQTAMFDPSTGSPTLSYFQQQAVFNPFVQNQMTGMQSPFGMVQPQVTGFAAPNPFMQPQITGLVHPQMTGYVQPQMTGMAPNPFRQSMMPTGQSPFGAFAGGQPQPQIMQQQATGMPFTAQGGSGFLQPQATGAGPFANGTRPMSVITSQATGSPFGNTTQPASPFMSQAPVTASSPFAPPQRVASPFGNGVSSPFNSTSSAPATAPLQAQKTGARNPFAPAPGSVPSPKQPPGPSMNQLAYNAFNQSQQAQAQQQQQQQQQQHQPQAQQNQQSGFANGTNGSAFQSSQPTGSFSTVFGNAPSNPTPSALIPVKTGMMGNIASEFASSSSPFGASSGQNASGSTSTTQFSSSSNFSPISTSNPTPFSTFPSTSGLQSPSSPLTSQPTGFGGSTMRAFQPTSTFGNDLAKEFSGASSTPFQSQSQTGNISSNFSTSNQNQNQFGTNSTGRASPFGTSNSSSSAMAPIQTQSTGFNPFRGSTLPPLNSPLSAQRTGFQPSSAFGASLVAENQGQGQGHGQQAGGSSTNASYNLI
ncbi:BZ3500_MvSof-1268-A1-R1_Chr9g10560 [Microbotryum saponariae]|uniref:BZ3500_MvSof-1268-A1-R1_Chr9g10560 protein n=1 Tax=Microbotryum saponariae TaxID=289078 RepID=A0A2X0L2A2_9BASI|nr:BZ3501_MvSof-1269-A2-R1_Chr9g10309 [Microbotryum saponariae]SDA00298.1 BZ3500_MvSof-1268-A1-R1_Chr9g10560 [Microbotryum saponariae]